METLDKLNSRLLSCKVAYNNVMESLMMYVNSSSDILRTESLNKIRRYGHYEKFSPNNLINISSHMRIYLHHKAMEEQLLKQKLILESEIHNLTSKIGFLKTKQDKNDEF